MAESQETSQKPRKTGMTRSRWLYIGSLIILVIVVVTFIGAPLITSTAGRGRLVFGRYGGEEIIYRPGNFFARQYEAVAQSLRDSGNQANIELQLRVAWREAFNRAVLQTAILQQVERADMRVSENRVDELIAADPRFQLNGRFDSDAYESTSNQELFSLREFHRETAKFDQFVRDVLTGSQTAEAERAFVASMAGPERSFDVVRFAFAEFPENQVRAFGVENPRLFSTLELSVVTLSTQEEAEQIRRQAQEPGNPVGDLARQYSRDLYADQDGDMGAMYGYELQQELIAPEDLDALLSLQQGEISQPLETTAGWAFYQAVEPPQPFDPSDEAELAEVRSYMQNFEQGRIQDFVRGEAEEFVAAAQADGLTAAAADLDRQVLSTPFFPINYGNLQLFGQLQSAEIPDLANAAFRQDFFETAFSLEPEAVSDPVVLRQSVVVLRLREEREALSEDVTFVSNFYDSLVQQFHSDAIEGVFVDQDELDDSFSQAFNRYVLGGN